MKFKSRLPFILASESPRREELFSKLGIPFDIQPSGITEELDGEYQPEDLAVALATMKAGIIADENPGVVVIGADTTVRINKMILSKPKNKQQAIMSLKLLSGKTHQVITGVSIQYRGSNIAFVETTDVTFYELSNEQIEAYVESGDPFDKAGGYGIQTMGGLFVQKINGDYNNVVGLPLSQLCRVLLLEELIFIDKGDKNR